MPTHSRFFCHLLAFITVAVWGTTFVSTKVLLLEGLTPAQVFTLRFVMAYVLLAAWMATQTMLHRSSSHSSSPGAPSSAAPPSSPSAPSSAVPPSASAPSSPSVTDLGRAPVPPSSHHPSLLSRIRAVVKRELLMLALGVTGGSLYFMAENEALNHTTATNTSLIVCSCPLFAMMFIGMVYPSERVQRRQWIGSLIAFVGMTVVVLNGRFVLHLEPIGDVLAFIACLCWAFYSLLMKPALARYSAMFVTRKVFFYGVLTILPYFIFVPEWPPVEVLLRPQVVGNLLFLGVIASMVCFLVWNWVIRQLGPVVATNWVYFNPITTMLFAWWLLGESITLYFIIGAVLILLGMYLADRK